MADQIHVTLSQAQEIAQSLATQVKNKNYAQTKDLGALANKSEVAKADLETTLASEITAATSGVAQNKADLETLNGTGAGSVKKAIDDAFNDFATKVSDDSVVNTYKELIDYAAKNGGEMATMAGKVSALETAVGGKAAGEKAATGLYKYADDAAAAAAANKVEKVEGMGLSQNSYTNEEKAKLASIRIATAAEVLAVCNALTLD